MRDRLRGTDARKARAALKNLVEAAKASCRTDDGSDEPQRLYYIKPGPKQWVGRIKVARRTPRREWRPVTHMAINDDWSDAQLEQFLYLTISRVPILRGPIYPTPPAKSSMH